MATVRKEVVQNWRKYKAELDKLNKPTFGDISFKTGLTAQEVIFVNDISAAVERAEKQNELKTNNR